MLPLKEYIGTFFVCKYTSVSISVVNAVQYRSLQTLQCLFISTERAVDASSDIYNSL